MAFYHISELYKDYKPFRFSDGFGHYVGDSNHELNDSVYCFPHYVVNEYGVDFAHLPVADKSLFDLAKAFQYKQLIIRTFDDVISHEFIYPFTTPLLENHQGKVWSNRERSFLTKFIEQETHIYLIQDDDTGFTKIGRSNNPQQRLKTLIKQDTLMPRPNNFRLLDYWEDNAMTEISLHKEFAAKRVRGEWFDLSETDIRAIWNFRTDRPLYF